MAMRFGKFIVGKVKSGPGRPAKNDILVKRGTTSTGKQGGADKRTKG